MMDVTLAGAFLAGLISFLSPCVLPLIPPSICFLAGVSLDQLTGEDDLKRSGLRVFFATLAFVTGFSLVFIAMGATASWFGQKLTDYFDTLAIFAGIIVIVMGLHFLGVFRIGLLYRQAKIEVREKPAGLLGAFLVGLAFAFGWSPCAGPVLAAILFIAGSEDSVGQGALLLGAYSMGIGVPYLVASVFAGAFLGFMKRFSRYLGLVEKLMGVLLILTGIAIMLGWMQDFGLWIQATFPGLVRG